MHLSAHHRQALDAGGVPEISRWRQPPELRPHDPAPDGAAEMTAPVFQRPYRRLLALDDSARRCRLTAGSGRSGCLK